MSATKIAILTDGSRGIGRDTVLRLASRGVRSIFTYNSNRAEADKVSALAEEAGAQAIALQLDTSNVAAFEGFAAHVRDALARLDATRFDYLVNNAGTSSAADHTALGRAGVPEDVGPVIAGLLSDDFGWVNAQRIEVAGGMQI
jgi:NAD(P)-dependent dehydrogenase (short-subunit alcohol dehydrogenase family)